MRPRTLLLPVLFVIGLIVFFLLLRSLFSSLDTWLSALLTFAVPVLGWAGRNVFAGYEGARPPWGAGSRSLSDVCRICLYGHMGSGKTTLIKNILLRGEVPPTTSTQVFDTYSGSVSVETSHKIRTTPLIIADYRGEKPSQAIFDVPREFTHAGQSVTNVLLFVVDLVPRLYNPEGQELKDEQVFDWLKDDPRARIEDRVGQHVAYINKYTIEIIFRTLFSANLKSVRLLINKIDVVQRLVAEGYVPGVDPGGADAYALDLFKDMADEVRQACISNGIHDFAVLPVSATRDIGMRSMIGDIVRRFQSDGTHPVGWANEPRTVST